jgi:hypothetical protein
MREYKFYTIGTDGHVAGPATVYVASRDADAVKEAKRRLDGHDIEIWQAERIVAYVVPDEK